MTSASDDVDVHGDSRERLASASTPSLRQVREGNGDWEANRKLVAYILESHTRSIEDLYQRQRADRNALESRLRALELRIAMYTGIAVAIVTIIDRIKILQ